MFSIADLPPRDIFNTAAMTALIIAIGHYFPWRNYFGPQTDGAPMPRIPAYIYGVCSIVVPLIGVFLMMGSITEAALLALNVIIAGLVTMTLYHLDGNHRDRQTAQEAAHREKHLREQLLQYEEQTRNQND